MKYEILGTINSMKALSDFEALTKEEKFKSHGLEYVKGSAIHIFAPPSDGWGEVIREGSGFEIGQYYDGNGSYPSRFKRLVIHATIEEGDYSYWVSDGFD